MTPVSRAGVTSQAAFSMNQAARRKATGMGRVSSICSMMPSWLSRFGWAAWAPTVERQTTLAGRAASRADRTAVTIRRTSGKPGAGSKLDGSRTKTPSAPRKAAVSAAASSIAASAMSQPRAAQGAALPASRSTARTGHFTRSRLRATAPPTWPVIPVMAYMTILLEWGAPSEARVIYSQPPSLI